MSQLGSVGGYAARGYKRVPSIPASGPFPASLRGLCQSIPTFGNLQLDGIRIAAPYQARTCTASYGIPEGSGPQASNREWKTSARMHEFC